MIDARIGTLVPGALAEILHDMTPLAVACEAHTSCRSALSVVRSSPVHEPCEATVHAVRCCLNHTHNIMCAQPHQSPAADQVAAACIMADTRNCCILRSWRSWEHCHEFAAVACLRSARWVARLARTCDIGKESKSEARLGVARID